MRISDLSSDVCSSDLQFRRGGEILQDKGYRRSVDALRRRREAAPDDPRAGAERQLPERVGFHRRQPQHGILARTAGKYQERSEEHTSELQSLMRISYAVFCLKKKKKHRQTTAKTYSKQRK